MVTFRLTKANRSKQFAIHEVQFIEIQGIANTINNSQVEVTDSISIMIPIGRVWKIEYAIIGRKFNQPVYIDISSGNAFIHINDVPILHSASNRQDDNFPIWLSAGTYSFKLSGSDNAEYKGFISAIEFNLTP